MKLSYFGNARTALKHSLIELDFDDDEFILIPEFICDAVLIPVNQLKLKFIYYSIDKTLSPDWNNLSEIIKLNKVKALIFIHYFGQPNNLNRFIEFARNNNLILIEDNAHGFGGKYNGKILGQFGDFGISSPRKTLNLPSGGILYSINSNSKKNKYALFPLYKPKYFLKLFLSFYMSLYNKIRYYKYINSNWSDPYLFKSKPGKDYKIDFVSKTLIDKTNWNYVGQIRRKNWILWSKFAVNNGLNLIYESLSPESCPWAIPLFAKDMNERNKWINWGLKNHINIFTWPSLPEKIIKLEGNSLDMWKCLVCISLDTPPKFNKYEN